MTIQDIADLPVKDVANPTGSVLFLWTTFPHLANAIRVIADWGYTYKTVGFLWVKLNPGRYRARRLDLVSQVYRLGVLGFIRWLTYFGTGFYTKSNPELCLLATRGKVLHPVNNKVPNLVFGPRGKHSAKPAAVNEKIRGLFGDGLEYLELFARRDLEDWTCVGNSLDGLDIRLALLDIGRSTDGQA